MNEELAYSIHLGSDKNRTNKAKEIAKTNTSGTTSFSNNAIQNAKQLSDANKHNLRDYDKNRDDIFVIYGSNNLFNDVRELYLQEFEQARIEYNEKQIREDRKIKDYFYKISQDSQRDLACEIIIELGDMDFWKDKDVRYKKKMSDVYNEQVKDLNMAIKDFEYSSFEIAKENRSLKYQIELNNDEIINLKSELSTKEKIISKLQTEKEKLKNELQKFKGFWHKLIKHFQNKIGFDKDEKYKYVSDDLYKNGIFDDNDNRIVNDVSRNIRPADEINNTNIKKKNNMELK